MKRFWCLGLALLGLPALAFGPREALAYQSPELTPARKALEAARLQAGSTALGLGANLAYERANADNDYKVGLGWQWNFTARLEAEQAVARAERELRRVEREGQKKALLAHATAWQAQSRLTAAEGRLEAARDRLAEVERKAALGAIAPLQREDAALALEQAELNLRQARNTLRQAQAEAARYGLRGNAEPRTVRFALPAATPEQTVAYREALAALELARARVEEGRRRLWPEASLGVSYNGKDALFQSGLSWSAGGPGANLALGTPLSVPPGTPEEWKFSLSLKLELLPQAWAAVVAGEADLEGAALRLERTREEMALRLEQAREEVAIALEGLELAQERLAIAERLAANAEAKLKAGIGTALERLEAQASRAEAEAAVAQGWQGYILAVAAYLDLLDGDSSTWTLQP